jgi:TolB-like protein/Flp pilus assembly protein TadD
LGAYQSQLAGARVHAIAPALNIDAILLNDDAALQPSLEGGILPLDGAGTTRSGMAEDQAPEFQIPSGRDAFISYASQDAAVANEIVGALEGHGIRCWIAPRNVTPGEFYADAIVRALNQARILVLVLTDHAIASPHVLREIERTSAKRHSILTLRVDPVSLPPALEYFLSSSQWLDATDLGVERALPALVEAARCVLAGVPTVGPGPVGPAIQPAAATAARPAAGARTWRRSAALATAALALAAGLVIAFAVSRLRERAPAPPRADAVKEVKAQAPRSIAVLPLVVIGPDHGADYLGDGLAEEVSYQLGRISGLRVAAQSSAFAVKQQSVDVRQIGAMLGVGYVLEGTIRRDGARIRITAELADATTGYKVWAQRYERSPRNLLGVQDEVARAIAETLQVMLSSEEQRRLEGLGTTNPEAFDRYLTGVARLRRSATASDLLQAEQSFRQALGLDAGFARAYAGLCESYTLAFDRTRDSASAANADGACRRALALDGQAPDVERAYARLLIARGRSQEAIEIFQRAIARVPRNADSLIGLARGYEAQQRAEDAERAYRRAIEVEPTYWVAYNALGGFLFQRGRTQEAVSSYQHVTALAPANVMGFNNLGAALQLSGNFDGAARAFERSLALAPTSDAYSNTGTMYYYMGRYPDAQQMLERAIKAAPNDHALWGNLADIQRQLSAGRPQAAQSYRRAIALAEEALRLNPEDAVSWAQLAYYRAQVGDAAGAARDIARARRLQPELVYVRYYASLVALAAGDRRAALEQLGHAIASGYSSALVRHAPEFGALRTDPEFERLLGAARRPGE